MGRKEGKYIIGENVDFTPIDLDSVDEARKFQARIIKGMEKKSSLLRLKNKSLLAQSRAVVAFIFCVMTMS